MKARHRHVRIEMTVYVLVQLKMTDRAPYDRYQVRFFDVFKKFSGRLLAADENPAILEARRNTLHTKADLASPGTIVRWLPRGGSLEPQRWQKSTLQVATAWHPGQFFCAALLR